ncbi:MAG: type I DNA topoisomerase [Acholeplasmatales bacterium]|jgi:DNA topoisomerase-1|nr:type I DNA topoisomerase [Acholeplasmatales bacterium]
MEKENLLIVESPHKSKTIQSYLKDKNFIVASSVGHIKDIKISGKENLGIDVDNDFYTHYSILPNKETVVSKLKELSIGRNVYLATDPDREGEAIAMSLLIELGLDTKDENRLVFNEITKEVILSSIEHPRKIDLNLVDAQEARRILDRIIGFRLSKLLQSRIGSKSAGRVQSVALKIIVDREKERNAFVPTTYYNIEAVFDDFTAPYLLQDDTKHITDLELAKQIVAQSTNPFYVDTVSTKEVKKYPHPAFTTSTLQQESINTLKLSSYVTMKLAQSLYDNGFITYMRTDSVRLSDVFKGSTINHIKEKYGEKYAGFYNYTNKDNSQDAHEAIRPTYIKNTPSEIESKLKDKNEIRLYTLIYNRALASMMSASLYSSKEVILITNGHKYKTNQNILLFDGFEKVLPNKDMVKNNSSFIKKLEPKDSKDSNVITINASSVGYTTKETLPPYRYTESGLIKELENKGIGRPSTYSTIISTLKSRDYTITDAKTKCFIPTPQGISTIDQLDKFFLPIINVTYTKEMEDSLDNVALGKEKKLDLLNRFYPEFKTLYDEAKVNMEKVQEFSSELCPICGNQLVKKTSKYGQFFACSDYPKCKYIKREPKEEPVVLDELCPECGSNLVQRKNSKGKIFIGCSGYPKCRYIKKDPLEEPQVLDELCPNCGNHLIKRNNSRGTSFIGCSNYPKCKYIKK